jgi:hypothetical protein
MSDSLVLINRILSRDKLDIPRFHDLVKASKEQPKEEEDPSDIIARMKSKADNLRG